MKNWYIISQEQGKNGSIILDGILIDYKIVREERPFSSTVEVLDAHIENVEDFIYGFMSTELGKNAYLLAEKQYKSISELFGKPRVVIVDCYGVRLTFKVMNSQSVVGEIPELNLINAEVIDEEDFKTVIGEEHRERLEEILT